MSQKMETVKPRDVKVLYVKHDPNLDRNSWEAVRNSKHFKYSQDAEKPKSAADVKSDYAVMWTLPQTLIPAGSEKHFCERVFAMFNDDYKNPLSYMRGGQSIVRANHTHTSMSIGDIVLIGKRPYIALPEFGFEPLGFEVA